MVPKPEAKEPNAVPANQDNSDPAMGLSEEPYDPIAIVGIGCRFPGAHGPVQYWEMLQKGEVQARPMPTDKEKRRWNNDHFYDPDPSAPGKIMHKTVCILDEVDKFDAEFFGISNKEAAEMDPQHRVLLETTYEALEDAGWSLKELTTPNNNVGVYVGAYAQDWSSMLTSCEDINNYSLVGRALFMISNRLSHWFGLEGPSMTIDTACSSSMTAIHLACRALQQGECRVALACGANILLHPNSSLCLSRQGVFARDGVLRAFDKNASGYVRGEGFGTLVLKPASQALADGDRIYAYVRSSVVHSGGKSKIITKPSRLAEGSMMVKALAMAQVHRDDIEFVEAHGTGTPVGDAIELNAIQDAYCPDQRSDEKEALKIGSVKSLIGHMEPASGIASVIKMALSLHYGYFTPNANFKEPNDVIASCKKLKVQTVVEPIQLDKEKSLVAVNSFGIGGTLAHSILQSGDSHTGWKKQFEKLEESFKVGWKLNKNDSSEGKLTFFPFSAASKAALRSHLQYWSDIISEGVAPEKKTGIEKEFMEVDASLVALCLSKKRSHLPHRVLLNGTSSATFHESLLSNIKYVETIAKNALQRGASDTKVLFMFPGQGPQCIWMAKELYTKYHAFQSAVHKVDLEFKVQTGSSLIEQLGLFQSDANSPKAKLLLDPKYCQSAIMMVQIGLVELLGSFGVTPSATIGHSAGEVAACWASGLLSLSQAVKVALARSATVGELNDTGGMLVVFASPIIVMELVDSTAVNQENWFCEIAALNSSASTVLSGNTTSLARVKEAAEHEKMKAILMHTTTPYHSSAIEPYKEVMNDLLDDLHCQHASKRSVAPFYSASLGREFNVEKDMCDRNYWWRNTRHPVRFHEAAKDMWNKSSIGDHPVDYVIEISNHPVLGSILVDVFTEMNSSGNSNPSVINPLYRNRPEHETFLETITKCYEQGSDLNWDTLLPNSRLSEVPVASLRLPMYSWNHQISLWNEAKSCEQLRRGESISSLSAWSIENLGGILHISLEADGFLQDHVVNNEVVFPAAGYMVSALRCIDVTDENTARNSDLPSLVLSNISFKNPLILNKSNPAAVAFKWPKVGGDVSRFSFANPSSSSAYCSGSVDVMTKTATQMAFGALTPPVFDDLSSNCVSKESIYEGLKKRGLHYGLSFRNIIKARSEGGYSIGKLRGISGNSRCFDIAILDSCFQLCILMVRENGKAYIPYGMERYIQIFQPAAHRELLVEAQVMGKHEGKIHFDIKIWESSNANGDIDDSIGASSLRLCAVCEKLIVSPLGDYEEANDLEYETVYQPVEVEISASDWKDVVDHMNQIKSELDDNVEEFESKPEFDEAIKEWSTKKKQKALTEGATDPVTKEPRTLYEMFLLSSIDELRGGDGGKMQVVVPKEGAEGALEEFNPTPQFRYSERAIRALMNLVKNAAQHMQVLRVAVFVPGRDGALVEAIWDYFDAHEQETQWWSNLELVFFFCDGSQPPISRENLTRQKRSRGISVRGEHCTSSAPPDLHGYDRGDFHALLSVNFHRVFNCERLLSYCSDLLAPGGVFASLEVTDVSVAGLLSLAAHESWWSFTDDRSVSWLGEQQWSECLGRSGFEQTMSVLLAKTPSHEFTAITARIGTDKCSLGKRPYCSFAIVANPNHQSLSTLDSIAEQCAARGIKKGPILTSSSPAYDDELRLIMDRADSTLTLVVEKAFIESQDPSTAIWTVMELLQPLSTSQNVRVVLVLVGNHPSFDGVVGLCRTLFYEKDFDLQVVLVHHDQETADSNQDVPVQQIAKVLCSSRYWNQPELHFRNTQWLAPKIIPVSHKDADNRLLSPKENQHWHLELPFQPDRAPGNNIKTAFCGVGPQLGRKPPKHDVRIAVKAIGLQFKLAMILLGMLPGYDMDNFSGGECSGVIEAVGDEEYASTMGIKVGDRVVACIGSSGVGTVMETPTNWTCKLPDDMTFSEAATIPVCFLTAYQGLVKMARIEKGDYVLVHSAAGGVGLAAIQIVKMKGGIAIASVSSEEKRKFLREHGVVHFTQSRSLDFEEEVMEITKGRGVDIVLNSLAGEALKAGIRCLACGGRFVEIGKVDILNKGRLPLEGFDNNLSFLSCHIDKMLKSHPQKVGEALSEIMELMKEGKLRPLHHTVHPMGDPIPEVLRMTKGKHIGKIVFTMPEEESGKTAPSMPLKPTVRRRLRPDSTYIIAGGLGSIGLSLAEQMAGAGAKSLVLVGRRPPRTKWQHVSIARIQALGVVVHLEQADVGDFQVVRSLIQKYSSGDNLLSGIANVAGVTDDAKFVDMTVEHVRTVMHSKATAAMNFHHATLELGTELDFFLMTSSLVGCIGNPGQTNYSAASLFLDGVMRLRHNMGLSASVLSIGAVEGEFGSGMIQHTNLIDTLSSRGMLFLSVDQAARAHLEMMKPDKWLKHEIFARQVYRYSDAIHKITRRYTHLVATGLKVDSDVRKRGGNVSAKNLVRQRIVKELASLLQMDEGSIDPEMPIANYGVDSLGTVHLISFLKSEARIVATQFDILGNATINSLLDRLPADINPSDGEEERPRESPSSAQIKDQRVAESALKEETLSPEESMEFDARTTAGDRLSTYSKLSQKGSASGRLKGNHQVAINLKNDTQSDVSTTRVDGCGGHVYQSMERQLADPKSFVGLGILGMEYFSSKHVVYQSEMEKMRGPDATGYFTTGFGQEAIACMMDHTNVVSLAMSALSRLFHTHGVSPAQVGYLAVGTESNPDRSKSIKSALMALFEESGNFNVEGVDHLAACYGGAAALFDAFAWMESSSGKEDGRLAVVVATDAALIEAPDDVFNGHGSFAVLLGRNAPIRVLPKRFSWHRNSWDFYVPAALNRFNPIVQFEESIECYLSSLEECRNGICRMFDHDKIASLAKYMVLHGPNVSMMRKGFRRLLAVEDKIYDKSSRIAMDKFDEMVGPTLTLVKNLGSLYTGSIFAGMYSLLYGHAEQVAGENVCVYAYGSGLGSSIFVLDVDQSWKEGADSKKAMLWTPLRERMEVSPQESQALLAKVHRREKLVSLPFTPSCNEFVPGAWYLKSITKEASCEYFQPLPHSASTRGVGFMKEHPAVIMNKTRLLSKTSSVPPILQDNHIIPFRYDPGEDQLLQEFGARAQVLDGLTAFVSSSFVAIVFTREQKKNTFDLGVLKCLKGVLQRTGNRIIIFRGYGESFCGGMDMSSELMTQPSEVHQHVALFQDVLTKLANHAAPVITVCHGFCLAGGTGFAAISDVVISHPLCEYGLPEINFGLLPVVVSSFLVRRVQKRVITELSLTGRSLTANEAVSIGLASYVVEDVNGDLLCCVKKMTSNGDLGIFAKRHLPAPDIDSAKTLMALLLHNKATATQTEIAHNDACTCNISSEGIATISICSKDASITPAVSSEFMKIVDSLTPSVEKGQVRAVILRGDSQHFCTGGDIAELAQWMAPNEMTTIARSYYLYVSFAKVRDLGIPVIVGFKGKVIGAGIGVGMLGDIRICTPTTEFDLAFFRHNISPGMATTATLAKAVSSEAFLDMISGTVIDAERALALGIVQGIVNEDELDLTLNDKALRFCRTDQRAVARTMKLLRQPVENVALLREAATQGSCFAELSRFTLGRGGEKLDGERLVGESPSNRCPAIPPTATADPKQENLVACFGGFAMTQSNSDQLEVKRLHKAIHSSANSTVRATILKIAEKCDDIVDELLAIENNFWGRLLLFLANLIAMARYIFGRCFFRTQNGDKPGFHAILSNPSFDDSMELHPYHVASAMILTSIWNIIDLKERMQVDFQTFQRSFVCCCSFSFGQLAALALAISEDQEDMLQLVSECTIPLALRFVREFHHGRPKSWSKDDIETNLVVQNVRTDEIEKAVDELNTTLDSSELVHISIRMTETVTVVSGYPKSLKKLQRLVAVPIAQYSYLWLPTVPHTPYGEECIENLTSTRAAKILESRLDHISETKVPILYSKDGPTRHPHFRSLLKCLFTEPVDWVAVSSIVKDKYEGATLVYFGPGDDESAIAFKANIMDTSMVSSTTCLSLPKSFSSLLSPKEVLVPMRQASARATGLTNLSSVDSWNRDQTVISTRESLQSGKVAALARYPSMPEGSHSVSPEYFHVSKFRDFQEWRSNVKKASVVGLRFPYFVEHDSVIRGTTSIEGRVYTDFSAYNYLGLAGEPEINDAASRAISSYGTSVSASRFASGERPIHRLLETELADFLGCEDSLVFSAGFLAIASAIVTLANDKNDLVLYDSLSHRSAVEGVLASAGASTVFPHNDHKFLDELLSTKRHEYNRVIVVIEGAYSMDGDLPDLPAFCRLRKKHHFLLMVDEAHSLGVVGRTGRGLSELFDVAAHEVDVWAGTLSKSLASCGGYLSGSREMVEYFKVFAPGFLFSAGITPPNTLAALSALRKLIREPFRVKQLQSNSRIFSKMARSAGLNTMNSTGECAVIPILIGDLFKALAVANTLYNDHGIHVQPIGSPAVPAGTERLRFFISSVHTEEEIVRAVQACSDTLKDIAKL